MTTQDQSYLDPTGHDPTKHGRERTELERKVYQVDEAAALLGLSKNSTYEAIKRGEIPTIRFGRRIVVPAIALDRILAEGSTLTQGTAADK